MDKMEIVIELPKDIDKLCRTCMNIVEEDRKSCVATDCSDQGIDLNKMLSQLMESNGSSEEYLPKFMCKNCVDKLESAYLFTQQCQNTYMHFQDFMYPAEKDKDDTEIKCNVNDSVEEISSLVNDRKEEINERNEIKLKRERKSKCFQKVFDTDLSLHLHFVNHAILAEGNTDPDIFNQYICCRTCGETFNCYEDLEDHQNSCLEFNKFKCTRCNKVFTSELNLLQHENELLHFNSEWEKLKLESTTKCFYMCPICDGMFTTKSELSLHSIGEGDGLPNLMCVQCVLQCSRAYTFKQQCEKSENILRQYMTPEFQEQLSQHLTNQTKVELQEQLQFSSNIDRVIVDQLPTEFVSVEYGDQNISIVKDEFVLINEVTGDIVAQIENQEKNDQLIEECSNEPPNEQTEEELKPLKYPCSKCKESFALKVDLKIHMMTHPKELEHICHVCQKGFAEARILKRHLKIHLDKKPHQCDQCDMSFAESSNLTKHKKKHTGELRNVKGKPYLCSVCGRAFKWPSSLSKHMKYHTGHKLLSCKYCSKQYVEVNKIQVK
ncbi:zinc finger protein [Holotrichia oblita]|uniref:Zinc finger protein n=1 Tax=Holotrichia oblita TaxID=644536 RepID=A0ACB9TDX3_HOLOL|nr:zinc finger protein [Holotrichia oblita]